MMRHAGPGPHAERLRALIVVMWRSGLRISEALALAESDLDLDRGAVVVRHGKGNKRREVGMDEWGWQQLVPWLALRREMPVGALLCIINGPNRGRPWTSSAARECLRSKPLKPECGADSRRTSCGTPTRSRWLEKASR